MPDVGMYTCVSRYPRQRRQGRRVPGREWLIDASLLLKPYRRFEMAVLAAAATTVAISYIDAKLGLGNDLGRLSQLIRAKRACVDAFQISYPSLGELTISLAGWPSRTSAIRTACESLLTDFQAAAHERPSKLLPL